MSKSIREKKRDDLRWELIVFADHIKLSGRAEVGDAYQSLKDMSSALSGNRANAGAESDTDPDAETKPPQEGEVMTAEDIREEADRLGSRLKSAGYYDSIQGALKGAELSPTHTTRTGEHVDTLNPITTLRDLSLRAGGFEAQIVASTEESVLNVLQRKHGSIESTVRNLISTVVDHSYIEPKLDDAGDAEPTFPVGSRSADEMLINHAENRNRAKNRDIGAEGEDPQAEHSRNRKQGTIIILAVLVLVLILFAVLGFVL